MLFAALRDMQWRKRRLIIAIASTAPIFGMTPVMTGLMNGFRAGRRERISVPRRGAGWVCWSPPLTRA
jgi:putative ABC transport system permease protein